MPEILAERERKAAKCHTCSYCGEVIQKGEVYDWVSAPFENVDFRRNGVSFLTGQHTGVIQP